MGNSSSFSIMKFLWRKWNTANTTENVYNNLLSLRLDSFFVGMREKPNKNCVFKDGTFVKWEILYSFYRNYWLVTTQWKPLSNCREKELNLLHSFEKGEPFLTPPEMIFHSKVRTSRWGNNCKNNNKSLKDKRWK